MGKQVLVPDVGDAADVEVIEILVAVGDTVEQDDSLIVLESDKASMEIPAPQGGKVTSIAVKEGDTVDEGDLILELEVAGSGDESDADDGGDDENGTSGDEPDGKSEDDDSASDDKNGQESTGKGGDSEADPAADESGDEGGSSRTETVRVPDVGDADEVTVTEILVAAGDQVSQDDSLIVLESDKASMEIPSPFDGTVTEVLVKEGDEVSQDDAIATMEVAGADSRGKTDSGSDAGNEAKSEPAASRSASSEAASSAKSGSASKRADEREGSSKAATASASNEVHAGPAVRKQAREYGVNLSDVEGSGRKGRILKEDIQEYVKKRLSGAGQGDGAGSGIPAMPAVDFSKFGEVSTEPLSRIRRSSARNLHRSWLNVPHVTQFDEADVTELEAFRKQQNAELEREGKKLTPLAFLVKAVAFSLRQFPHFNASLDEGIENFIIKHYYNVGIAVDTPDGLVVPVIRDADKKGVIEIAEESAELAAKARDKKLPLDAMQGATFSISSLGGIGGTAFTPIVNAPEVAILGVSRTKVAPVWDGNEFRPRTMLPLSLSYDHRAIDGAEAARFTAHLASVLSDVRRLIL